MPTTPDRVTFSIPPDAEIDADALDEIADQHGFESRSEFIRWAIRQANDAED